MWVACTGFGKETRGQRIVRRNPPTPLYARQSFDRTLSHKLWKRFSGGMENISRRNRHRPD